MVLQHWSNIMTLACSGGAHMVQITNQADVELTHEGYGCPVGCARAIFAREGIPLKNYVVVTGLGIEKVKDRALALRETDIAKIMQAGKEAAGERVQAC